MARASTSGGPGVGSGGVSREGGCEREDCDEFGRPLIRVLSSVVIVIGSEPEPIDGRVGGIGMGGVWAFSGFLT